MPKIAPDEILVAEVRRFIEETGGVAPAASRLGVEKTMLWRFARSGRAISKNRLKLRAALSQTQNAIKTENATPSAASVKVPSLKLSASTLSEMRSTLTNMIVLIDAYSAMG
jgi:hypothetical protein